MMLSERIAASAAFAARPRALALMLAAVFAAAVGYSVARIPIQVSDSLVEILEAQRSPSVAASFSRSFDAGARYLRPMRIAQIKALFDGAQGRYQLAYRGFHVLLVFALVWLFVRALRVESYRELAVAVFAVTVLTGMHTFLGLVREAFPINHFLEIAVFCLVALNLAQSRGGPLVDAAALALFAIAVLTLESGVLVWVVLVAAWSVGLRGISSRGVALVTVLLGAYLFMRLDVLLTPGPVLAERASGFMFERLEPDQIQQRFGDRAFVYFLYNVGASLSSVFASEPRDGVFEAIGAWRSNQVVPRNYVAVISSMATTAMIGWWFVSRLRPRLALAPSDRLGVVALMVCAANAVLSFGYAKDEIVSVAGVFYGLAAYAAGLALLDRISLSPRTIGVTALAVTIAVVGSAWTVRSFGVHHVLREQAFRIRNDWVRVAQHLQQAPGAPASAESAALVAQLRQEAVAAPGPILVSEWSNRWFGN